MPWKRQYRSIFRVKPCIYWKQKFLLDVPFFPDRASDVFHFIQRERQSRSMINNLEKPGPLHSRSAEKFSFFYNLLIIFFLDQSPKLNGVDMHERDPPNMKKQSWISTCMDDIIDHDRALSLHLVWSLWGFFHWLHQHTLEVRESVRWTRRAIYVGRWVKL